MKYSQHSDIYHSFELSQHIYEREIYVFVYISWNVPWGFGCVYVHVSLDVTLAVCIRK